MAGLQWRKERICHCGEWDEAWKSIKGAGEGIKRPIRQSNRVRQRPDHENRRGHDRTPHLFLKANIFWREQSSGFWGREVLNSRDEVSIVRDQSAAQATAVQVGAVQGLL